MRLSFREHHLFSIFSLFEEESLPLDIFLRNYFKKHSAIGSKDRKMIAEAIYGIIRWKGLLDAISYDDRSWKKRFETFSTFPYEQSIDDPNIAPYAQVSFPKFFFEILEKSLGAKEARAFCLVSNEQAPITIRANALKTSREELIESLKKYCPVFACQHAPYGIHLAQRINFFSLDEFKAGLFEVQDEASQLVADKVEVKPGSHFLDFCAGSGGKALAIAPKMQGRGQIYLHDIRCSALYEAKKRMKRAGIQNVQFCFPDSKQKKSLIGHMDWVLVDAPCSGTGTLRRNPDAKWKFDEKMIPRIVQEQRAIFNEALKFVKPKGHIVYATCSVLPEENENQAAYFLKEFPVRQVGPFFKTFPVKGGMDGFFAVVFQKVDLINSD